MSNMIVETTLNRGTRHPNYLDREAKAFYSDHQKALVDFGERVAMISTKDRVSAEATVDGPVVQFVAKFANGDDVTVYLY